MRACVEDDRLALGEAPVDHDRVAPAAAAAAAPLGIYSGYFRDPDGRLWDVIWNPRRRV